MTVLHGCMVRCSCLSPLPPCSALHRVVALWREDLARTNPKAAQSLADPADYENLFPDLQLSLKAEQFMKNERSRLRSAVEYQQVKVCHLSSSFSYIALLPVLEYQKCSWLK